MCPILLFAWNVENGERLAVIMPQTVVEIEIQIINVLTGAVVNQFTS